MSSTYTADLVSLADEDASVELGCEDCGNATGSKPGTGGRLTFWLPTLHVQHIAVDINKYRQNSIKQYIQCGQEVSTSLNKLHSPHTYPTKHIVLITIFQMMRVSHCPSFSYPTCSKPVHSLGQNKTFNISFASSYDVFLPLSLVSWSLTSLFSTNMAIPETSSTVVWQWTQSVSSLHSTHSNHLNLPSLVTQAVWFQCQQLCIFLPFF